MSIASIQKAMENECIRKYCLLRGKSKVSNNSHVLNFWHGKRYITVYIHHFRDSVWKLQLFAALCLVIRMSSCYLCMHVHFLLFPKHFPFLFINHFRFMSIYRKCRKKCQFEKCGKALDYTLFHFQSWKFITYKIFNKNLTTRENNRKKTFVECFFFSLSSLSFA